jgi:dipeptidyl aminopeptidase/acylaminoacyl peptidase
VARTNKRNIRWVQPHWLPGDSGISVAQRTGAIVGSGPLLVFTLNGRRQVIVPKVGETYDWSPSGDRLAYTIGGALTIAQRDGTELETFGESNAIDIGWSPDGKKVAFSLQEILETDIQYVAIYVIDVEKGERRRFVLAEGLVAYFDWEPLPADD